MKSSYLSCMIAGAAGAVVAMIVPFLVSNTQADTRLLPFQGRLTDAAGSAVGDGAKVVEFMMYDSPTGPNVKWAGEVHKLSVNGGLANTMLGSKASLGAVDFSTPTYLQITIDANGDNQINAADPPLLPRQSVVPAVYAAVAGQMQYMVEAAGENPAQVKSIGWDAVFTGGNPEDGTIPGAKLSPASITAIQMAPGAITGVHLSTGAVAGSHLTPDAITSNKILDGTILPSDLSTNVLNGLVPAGSVSAYGGSVPPDGWLLCDGRPVSRADYAALYASILHAWGAGDGSSTFNLPDLRGYFLRGVDSTPSADRDVDYAARYALKPGGQTARNAGSYQDDQFKSHTHLFRTTTGAGGSPASNLPADSNTLSSYAQETDAKGGSETRPKNAYVHFIIKH